MKYQIKRSLLCVIPFVVGLAPLSQGQWLTHTPDTTQQPGYATTAVFSNITAGPYSGSVKVRVSNDSSGSVPGILGLSPNPWTNLTPSFLNYPYPTDAPGGTFDFLNVEYNDNLDTYTVTFDFTGLANGYLPSKTLIAFLDVDILEDANNISATGPAGPIAGPWLGPVNTALPVFDYDYTSNSDGIIPSLAAVETYLGGGVYQLQGTYSNQTATFQGFITRQKITTLSFICARMQSIPSGTGGYAVAILGRMR